MCRRSQLFYDSESAISIASSSKLKCEAETNADDRYNTKLLVDVGTVKKFLRNILFGNS